MVFLGEALRFPNKNHFSLFFNPEEEDQIQKVHQRQPSALHHTSHLQLNAILFTDKNNWTIWINGQKITPTNPSMYLVIKKVSPEYIHATWKHKAQDYELKLRINQIFIPEELYPR